MDSSADAGGHRLHEHLPDAAGRLLGGARRALDARGQVGEQHEELVAAVAPDEVGRPGRAAKAVRDRHEQLVTHVVAEAVVHDLEVVQVHVHRADRAPVLARPGDRLVQRGPELVAVREAP